MILAEFDVAGKVKDSEQIFYSLLGYSEKEIKMLKLENLMSKPHLKNLINKLLENNKFDGTFDFINNKGKVINISGSFVKIFDNKKSRTYFVINNKINKPELKISDNYENKFDKPERLNELATINQISNILKAGRTVIDSLQQLIFVLPNAFQFPNFTSVRIKFKDKEFKSKKFEVTQWKLANPIFEDNIYIGEIEIYYNKKFPNVTENSPFLNEEIHLINKVAQLVSRFIIIENNTDSKYYDPYNYNQKNQKSNKKISNTTSRHLLQDFLNKYNTDRDIYHDLMPFKVKEILFVATLYDAYNIEKEGRFTEHILGEYHQLNLTSLPRITGVTNTEEAHEILKTKHFDLIIVMLGSDKQTPVKSIKLIKQDFPYIPIYVLLNNNSDVDVLVDENALSGDIDKVFIWNGDSKVFFAMVKLIEDKLNVENDTQIGMVRVVLLVEDSPKYYSRYLPMLYNIVLGQTKQLIEEAGSDELYKVMKLRARPKILLASNYEDAVNIFNKYKDYMLCTISDVKFCKDGILDDEAGFKLVKHINNFIPELPIVLQSSDIENEAKAHDLKKSFINKHSESLMQDLKSFIVTYLGFGNFIFRDVNEREIAVAKNIQEFEYHLKNIPPESVIFHAMKDHFSLWLMASGEIRVSQILNPVKVEDFKSGDAIRKFMLNIIRRNVLDRNVGKVIPFDDNAFHDESNILSLSSGAIGGKGRGLSFINSLVHNFDFASLVPNINIKIPKTMIVGTDEYEQFLENNNLIKVAYDGTDYETVKTLFVNAKLSDTLKNRLRIILNQIKKPIAVRSSGLFEDSLVQPFAGIFETFLLPNNHHNTEIRLEQTMNAIKLVYASVFSGLSRGYIDAINYKIEEEKMAVVIQEVVGNEFDGYFYPHISGVAQSYNYYPYAYMKPEEGFVVTAVGLGKYVVEGERAYRFSPKYPEIEINSTYDQLKNTQNEFYAVNLKKNSLNLLEGEMAGLIKLDIEEAEKHGTLKHCASVYDNANDRIIPGLTSEGQRIVNFANILKYDYIPLAKTISILLDVAKDAFGSPAEIEFAVDLNKDAKNNASFYFLQIKPLIGNSADFNINMNEIAQDSIVLYAEKGMGNGIVSDIYDVIYIDIEKFDKTKTEDIAFEIEKFNSELVKLDKKYVLIGPGRWGSRDRFIGIPVTWPQISNAKIIVETSLKDYPLDASLGSHFFHNVTSMNVGYLSVQQELSNSFIDWTKLENQTLIKRTKYVKHIRFDRPLTVRMDGKQRISVVTCEK